jgi:ABC-type polysaccharide/polyol phosphate export permease
MMIVYGVAPAPPMLAFPIFLLLQLSLTIGLALITSVGTAFFRDVRHFVDIGLATLFWATPIVYETTQISERLQRIILLAPLSPYITAYHDIFYYRQWPSAEVWILAAVYGTVPLAAGLWLITRVEDRLTEQV